MSIEVWTQYSEDDEDDGSDEEANVLGFTTDIEVDDHHLSNHIEGPDQSPSFEYSDDVV